MKATILYEVDCWHSRASRRIIGVYTNKRELMRMVNRLIKQDQQENPKGFDSKEELQNYIKWNFQFFFEQGQTQGLFHCELDSEQIDLNKEI